jgi:hypothetical protein
MPTKFKIVECLCTPETLSETRTTIIDEGRENGYTYCSSDVDEDRFFCFLYVLLSKEEPSEKYAVEV